MGLFLCCNLVLPLLPIYSYLFYLLVVNYHVHGYDVTRDGASIGQTRESSTVHSCKRYNEAMLDLLWMDRKSACTVLLLQWHIDHHNIWSHEQRCLQSKNFWTVQQAS